MRTAHRVTAPALARLPISMQGRFAATQRADRPMFGPVAATTDGPPNLGDAGPLYAGECIDRIDSLRPAANLVADLAGR
jgi:hypothetical protein